MTAKIQACEKCCFSFLATLFVFWLLVASVMIGLLWSKPFRLFLFSLGLYENFWKMYVRMQLKILGNNWKKWAEEGH
jgi:hypothetical protein